jgi:hypothetical protein
LCEDKSKYEYKYEVKKYDKRLPILKIEISRVIVGSVVLIHRDSVKAHVLAFANDFVLIVKQLGYAGVFLKLVVLGDDTAHVHTMSKTLF